MQSKRITIADILTLTRLFLSPCIIPLLAVTILPYNDLYLNCVVGFLFLLFGCTDFLDGYLARNYYGSSHFGAIIDPVADKMLMLAGFLSLLAVQKMSLIWVMIFISRETLVMVIRYFALQKQYKVPVSSLGKIKTALQIILVTVAMINPDHRFAWFKSWWNIVESVLLYSSVFFSIYSVAKYYQVIHSDFVATIPRE